MRRNMRNIHTVNFMLSPPPHFLDDFGVRVNIVFNGKYQISRSQAKSPTPFFSQKILLEGGGVGAGGT